VYLTGGQAIHQTASDDEVAVNERGDIRVRVGPEPPSSQFELAVLRVLARVAGLATPTPAAGSILDALAALLAARAGIGADAGEIDRRSFERHVVRREPPVPFAAARHSPADLSFLRFVERRGGRPALTRFVQAARRGELESAAINAFGTSFGELQAAWLDALRTQHRGPMTGEGVLRKALPLLRPHWPRGVELLALMALDLVFNLAIPLSSVFLFDHVIVRGDYGLLGTWLGVVLVIFAVGSVASYRRVVVGQLIGELILRDLRRATFARMQNLAQRFHSQSSTGDLLQRIGGDLDNVQEALGQALPVLVFQLVSLVVGAIALLVLSWQLGLIVLLISIPLFGFVYLRASDRLADASRDLQDRIGAFMGYVQEHLAGQQLVKSYGLERRAIAGFEKILASLFGGSLRLIKTAALLQSSSNMIFHGTRVVVLAIGAVLVLNDQMTVGELVAFVALIVQVIQPVVAISEQYQHVQAAAGAFDRVQEIMDEAPDVVEDPLATDLPDVQREIRLDSVSFGYVDGHLALSDLSLTIPARSKVAIVGTSGAGKSTLLGLLLRLHDPTAGRILFDGHDIRSVKVESLRRQLAYVPQETFLFNTTMAENIALGREGATEADVDAAARAAALDSVIAQADGGLLMEVGERGGRLSGGQRQRVAIARALVRNPRVLILDEATSALDPETEAAVLQTLTEVGRGRTVIAITHRLSTVTDFDQIVVLDQGRLVEQGTHQQLYQQRGLYWRLHREQQRTASNVDATPDDGEGEAIR
jgi:ATP-binding cassette, subfamily B, bacterial